MKISGPDSAEQQNCQGQPRGEETVGTYPGNRTDLPMDRKFQKGDRSMNVQEAVMAFSQSDKIKSGIIWANQALALFTDLSPAELNGAERIVKVLVSMIAHEIHLAGRLAPDEAWDEVEKHVDMAVVMVNSKMIQESGFHLIQALTRVTSIAQRSMTVLKDKGIL
ncbi:MAG: hypothetical protein ABII68_04125 [Pseudomonadota bacterium]